MTEPAPHGGENVTLTRPEAEAVWSVLEETCGAGMGLADFVYAQTRKHVTEWRFCGSLGFGGKFWRTHGRRPDGSWGEVWVVNCYPEDRTPERDTSIEAANSRLWDLQRGRRIRPDTEQPLAEWERQILDDYDAANPDTTGD